jgi:hypothetical protein
MNPPTHTPQPTNDKNTKKQQEQQQQRNFSTMMKHPTATFPTGCFFGTWEASFQLFMQTHQSTRHGIESFAFLGIVELHSETNV